MNNFLSQITPHTCGIIWLVKDGISPKNSHYAPLDYILDGLLTATMNSSELLTSQVIMGKNFGKDIYVLVVKDLRPAEISSYFNLVKTKLSEDADMIVIDDADLFANLQKATPKEITKKFRII